MEDLNKRRLNFLSLSEHGLNLNMALRNSAKKEFALHLTKLMSWRNCNEIERTQN